MNYCHACRRHLNGALACAGCGTPAEYLIPAPSAAAPGSVPRAAAPPQGLPTELSEVFADSLVVLSAPNERRAGARRRVTHRRRRRNVLTLAVGLLIAVAGSMAVARMAADGESTDRAANVVLTDDGPQQPAPLPDAPTPGAPTGSGKATAKATAVSATRTAGAAGTSGGVTQPGPTSSAPAPATSAPASRTPGPGSSVQGGASGKPSQSATANTQAPPPPTSPSPSPSPTKKPCGLFDFSCWF
ncbi:hypothetical protein ACIQZO_00045 [Streptomyces sp. NPDC097617]|uniref:SCO2400 family protein n=1 Tax=Streptomyces sp. NPDC097617 TaxID=3366091 RepID=UPI003821DD9A